MKKSTSNKYEIQISFALKIITSKQIDFMNFTFHADVCFNPLAIIYSPVIFKDIKF
ncbi:hypothetical protein E5AUHO_21210 [Citrobacter freundii]|nr:hypothetical protein E5AUHO_21210 [Citrobacter freundii]